MKNKGWTAADIPDQTGRTAVVTGGQRTPGKEKDRMNAYVLVQTDSNTEPIAGLLRAVPGVLFAEDVRGPYDALALAQSDSSEGTLQGILAQVRELPGVIRALPAPLVPSTTAVRDREAA